MPIPEPLALEHAHHCDLCKRLPGVRTVDIFYWVCENCYWNYLTTLELERYR